MNRTPLQREEPPTWDWAYARSLLPDLLEGLWITVQIAVLGMGIALLLGLALAVARRTRLKIISWPVGLVVEFIRSTPLLIQLFVIFYVLPNYGVRWSGFVCGVVGLGIHYACYASEAYRAGIESIARGQWEAATAINLSRRQQWTSVILPQAIPTSLPALGNYFVASFKDAPLASTITVFGVLGTAQSITGRTFRGLEPYTMAGLLFLAVSVPAAILARNLERRYGYERT